MCYFIFYIKMRDFFIMSATNYWRNYYYNGNFILIKKGLLVTDVCHLLKSRHLLTVFTQTLC